MTNKELSAFERLRETNFIVAGIMQSGGTPEDCCVALALALQQTAEKAMHYMLLAPRKIRLSDGTVKVWHCPDEMIPEMKI